MGQELYTIMTRKGQITVPAEIRRALGLRIGDRVALSLREGDAGEATLRPIRSVALSTYGMAPARREPVSIQTMKEQFALGLVQDALQGLEDTTAAP